MEIVNKATVLKQVRQAGFWEGFIAPDKVHRHVNAGWHIGVKIRIELAQMHDRPSKYVIVTNGRYDIDKYLKDFQYYNCCYELGYRIRFWQ